LEHNINNFLSINNSVYRVYKIDDDATINDYIQIKSIISDDIITTKLCYILDSVHLFVNDRKDHDENREYVRSLTKEEATQIVLKM